MNCGPFNLLIKPTGGVCNVACTYCYYREKTELYPASHFRMDDATLERITEAYIANHPGPEVAFGWQGGEPLLMGRAFFERALELQRKHARPGLKITNTLQTNGTLLDDEWGAFFASNQFLIGISIDGPAELHDRFRRDLGGRPTHAAVRAGIATLQRHRVEHNALVTVNRANVQHPVRVYQHITGLGIRFLQFIPIVESDPPFSANLTPWSVRAEPYGKFLCAVFDHWARNDVGRVFVQVFESMLSVMMGQPPAVCVYSPVCGRALVVEHTGDLYACDHFVYPSFARGAVTREALPAVIEGDAQREFGEGKAKLPPECERCGVLPFCYGDCPKHRLRDTSSGRKLSMLCEGHRRFFTHASPVLESMASALRSGYPASVVMDELRRSRPGR